MAANPDDVEALFPSGSVPEVRMNKLGTLCQLAGTPRLMSGLLRQFLVQHYADPHNIFVPIVRGWLQKHGVWRQEQPSGLTIETIASWKPEEMQARPALVIKAGNWRWQRVGIGDQAGVTWRDGVQHYLGHWQGSHTVFAIGYEAAETQALAEETTKFLLWYGKSLEDEAVLHRFAVAEMGQLYALKECKEAYVSPITLAYVKEENWQLQPDAPRLKHIKLDVNDALGYG